MAFRQRCRKPDTLPALGLSARKQELQGKLQELNDQLCQQLASFGVPQVEPRSAEELGNSTQALLQDVQAEVGPQRALELRLLSKVQATQDTAMSLMQAMTNRFAMETTLPRRSLQVLHTQNKPPRAKRLEKTIRAGSSAEPPESSGQLQAIT